MTTTSYTQINSIDFSQGINVSAPILSSLSQATLAENTWNSLVTGNGLIVPHKGSTAQSANSGSRKMLPFSNTWGGIRDIGATQGSGSFFLDVGNSRWFLGSGQGMIAGVDATGVILTSNLQLQIPTAGVYGPVLQAGLAQPSAPEVGIVATTGLMSNSMSAKISSSRPSTGAISVASPTSAVINPQGNQMRVTFPVAATTHWRVFFTFQGFGGTGIHYLGSYGGDTDIPESVVAAGTVDGIARSLVFNFQDGDLIPIEASFDDYPPPAATHAIRLQNVLNLAGVYADSSPGTTIAVSKENNYESYVPTSLLFLPEPVIDTLARPIDDYGYIGCQNSIHAIQYVGNRGDELPPCTITTILPDIGIEYPHNWCHFRGQLLIYTAQGNLLLIDEKGNVDSTFAGPVTKILKTFTTETTAVGYDPQNDAILVLCGKRILFYSLASRQWRQIWLPDFGITGTTVSCTTAQRKLYFTVDNAGVKTAYSFDTGTNLAPLSFICNYQNSPGGNATVKDIYEMAIAAETGATSSQTDFAVSISKNRANAIFRRVSTTSGSVNIGNTGETFYPAMVGKRVLLFGNNVGAASTILFHGLVSAYTSATSITLTNLSGAPFNPILTTSELLMFVGDYTAVVSFTDGNFPNFFPNLPEARSYQVACWFRGTGIGNVLAVELIGDAYSGSRAI